MQIKRETIQQRIFRIRYTAYTGTPIPQHHSMRKAHFSTELLISIVLIPVVLDFLLIYFNPLIANLWDIIFNFWIKKLSLDGSTGTIGFQLFGEDIISAYPDVNGEAPSNFIWWTSYIIGIVIFYLTFFFKSTHLPLAYFIRLVLLLIFTSHIFFLIYPDFTYEVSSLVGGSMLLSYKLLLMAPWVMSLTYNIFDFSVFKKFMISILVVGYFIVFIPFQFTMQVLIINKLSLLFLPVLHLLFGSLLDILLFMAIYSWGLSWKRKKYKPIWA